MAFADEARAIDHVGPVVEDRLDQPRVFGRIVFQVGVLNDHHVAGRVPEAFAEGRALPLVVRLVEDANLAALQLPKKVARAVRAIVIHQNDFFRDGHFLHPADERANPLALVVDRDDDGKLEPLWDRIDAELTAGGVANQAAHQLVALRGGASDPLDQPFQLFIPHVQRRAYRHHTPPAIMARRIPDMPPRRANYRRQQRPRSR